VKLILNFILSPVGLLVLFLLGVAYDVLAQVPGEGIQRLYALIPCVLAIVSAWLVPKTWVQ
jgi:hypothetical protein